MASRELRDAGHSPQTASQMASQRDPLPVAQHKFGSHDRALQANDLRHRRRSIIILSIVYGLQGLLLLPWPIASFMAIFFFDAPIRSSGDQISRYLAAFSFGPCGKRVSWSSWGRRLTDLARARLWQTATESVNSIFASRGHFKRLGAAV
jgi:hypothetical protein